MVVGVVCGPIDYRSDDHGDPEVPVVYGNRPDVDQYVHDQVRVLVHWEEEHVDVVGTALKKTVHRVEGVTSKRRGNLENAEVEKLDLQGYAYRRNELREM